MRKLSILYILLGGGKGHVGGVGVIKDSPFESAFVHPPFLQVSDNDLLASSSSSFDALPARAALASKRMKVQNSHLDVRTSKALPQAFEEQRNTQPCRRQIPLQRFLLSLHRSWKRACCRTCQGLRQNKQHVSQ